MKKLLAVLLFAFTLGGCVFHESPAYKIDEVATAAAPWAVGGIMSEDQLHEESTEYRRFLGVTTRGHYLVQDFYKDGDTKASDPYRLIRRKRTYIRGGYSFVEDGPYVRWYITGEKKREVTLKKGLNIGSMTEWFPNGQKKHEALFRNGRKYGQEMQWHENGQLYIEAHYQNGDAVGIWRQWDEQGNLVCEYDHSPAQ